jgi:hypothetical protein
LQDLLHTSFSFTCQWKNYRPPNLCPEQCHHMSPWITLEISWLNLFNKENDLFLTKPCPMPHDSRFRSICSSTRTNNNSYLKLPILNKRTVLRY